jgi:hypothetical protein
MKGQRKETLSGDLGMKGVREEAGVPQRMRPLVLRSGALLLALAASVGACDARQGVRESHDTPSLPAMPSVAATVPALASVVTSAVPLDVSSRPLAPAAPPSASPPMHAALAAPPALAQTRKPSPRATKPAATTAVVDPSLDTLYE